MKVLLVTMYFPPAGGGGVQRSLKFATHLPELGIETHVLAPDDPKWIHRDDGPPPPTLAWVHRARYLGPKGRKPAEELHGATGLDRASKQLQLMGRRLLVPDENVSWNLTAIPAAIRIVKREGIDVVITTSPPSSVHLVGAAVKRATGIPWVADLRDSVVAHPHRDAERMLVRAKEQGEHAVARLITRSANAIVCVSDAIAAEMRERDPNGEIATIANGSDFDDFDGLEHTSSDRFRLTHAGSFFGKRDPRPFLTALHETGLDIVARFLGDFRSSDREWAERLELGDRLELIPYAPRRRSLELQRDSEALLLLIPEAGGRGKGVLSGKVFEYLAAERPILALVPPEGAAAELIRDTGAGMVVAPEDVEGIKAALGELHGALAARRARGAVAVGRVAPAPLTANAGGGARPAAGAARMTRVTSFLFLATLFVATFEKVHWNVAGTVSISDVLALLFLASLLATMKRPRVPMTTAVLLGFFAVFLAVYLTGYFDLSDSDALGQWAKGLTKWAIHFSFLAAAVFWLSRRGREYFWRALAWFCAGIVVNALYGVLQLLDARRGANLDATVLSPITGGASQINIYGAINGVNVYRPNAMTGDPNHLGIMLIVPLLILTPLYLRLEQGHRMRKWLMLTIGFLLIVEAATLSRSGLLGLAVGALVLAVPYRGYLRSRALLVPVGAAFAILLAVVLSRRSFFTTVLKSRVQTSGGSENAHFQVYSFIPHVLHTDPLFGLGLNTFSVYYEFVTGKTNWGPHSYYVALLVETGVVGTALFGVFLFWVFRRLRAARALGRALSAAHDPLAARVRPLAWGCTAALAGTLASNAFYLTMQFYYFYAFVALALAIPVVFARSE